jgi:PBP1b-binding outer membrane lipoprotein LpoB
MLNQSRTILVAAVALVLSACSSDDNEEASTDETVLDAPAADDRRSPEIAPGDIEDTPETPADTPALAGAALPGPVGEEAIANDPPADWDLPYLPNCWPLHECLIDE